MLIPEIIVGLILAMLPLIGMVDDRPGMICPPGQKLIRPKTGNRNVCVPDDLNTDMPVIEETTSQSNSTDNTVTVPLTSNKTVPVGTCSQTMCCPHPHMNIMYMKDGPVCTMPAVKNTVESTNISDDSSVTKSSTDYKLYNPATTEHAEDELNIGNLYASIAISPLCFLIIIIIFNVINIVKTCSTSKMDSGTHFLTRAVAVATIVLRSKMKVAINRLPRNINNFCKTCYLDICLPIFIYILLIVSYVLYFSELLGATFAVVVSFFIIILDMSPFLCSSPSIAGTQTCPSLHNSDRTDEELMDIENKCESDSTKHDQKLAFLAFSEQKNETIISNDIRTGQRLSRVVTIENNDRKGNSYPTSDTDLQTDEGVFVR